ncbi:MAG: hypothetical protein K8R90_09335 [Candidatus Cloacimonetes bacterium]|nr:hypothetical protein [Candidatus Cloacimonadota bacterium]
MADYIFLDTSVLLHFTNDPSNSEKLSRFIHNNDLSIMLNEYSFIELYNPNKGHSKSDRVDRICQFLSKHPLYIIETEKLWKMAIIMLPSQSYELPTLFPFPQSSPEEKRRILIGFLRAENWWLKRHPDLDIRGLNKRYRRPRKRTFMEFILTEYTEFIKGCEDKPIEEILITDCISIAKQAFDAAPIPNFLSALLYIKQLSDSDLLQALPLHCIALANWYAYGEKDKGYTHKIQESDCADVIHLSLLPFCKVFTIDKTMARIAVKVANKLGLSAQVLNHAELRNAIGH